MNELVLANSNSDGFEIISSNEMESFFTKCLIDISDQEFIQKLTCSFNSVEDFHSHQVEWSSKFDLNKQQELRCLQACFLYQQAIKECDDFDIIECLDQNTCSFEAFYSYVLKHGKLHAELENTAISKEFKRSVYETAFERYFSSKFDINDIKYAYPIIERLLNEHKNKSANNMANLTRVASTVVGVGAGTLAGFGLTLGSAPVLGAIAGEIIGAFVSSAYLEPIVKEHVKNMNNKGNEDEFVIESIETEELEKVYVDALDKLNLHRLSKLNAIKNTRRNYLLALGTNKSDHTEENLNRLNTLENAFKIVRDYRKKQKTWF